MRHSGWGFVVSALAVALIVQAPAVDAAAPAQDQAEAIRLFEEGEAQFRAGRFDAAAGLFKRAFETWEDPAYLYNIAYAFEKGERWRLAVQWYDRFLARYADSPNASDVRARRDAAAESREATRASVYITSEPAGARATVLSNEASDESGASCVTPCLLKVDPGPVAIRVELGQAHAERSRSLAPAERWDLDVPLPMRDTPVDRTPSWVAWGIGGASLVTGIVLAALADSAFDRGKALVGRAPLDADDQRKLGGLRGDVRDLSLGADIGFAGALVGATVGTVWWFSARDNTETPVPGASW